MQRNTIYIMHNSSSQSPDPCFWLKNVSSTKVHDVRS